MSDKKALDLSEIPNNLIDLSAAASILGVSSQTLRRMEERGKVSARRTSGGDKQGGHRRFYTHDILRLAEENPEEVQRRTGAETFTPEEVGNLVPADEAARLLGVSRPTLRRWEREGKLVAHRQRLGKKVVYNRETIEKLAELGA